MDKQIPISNAALADSDENGGVHEITPELAYRRLVLVNVIFVGPANAGDGNWVLVDAGIPGSTGAILRAIERRYGKDARPAAIVLTHGHFDHVGALEELAARWEVPIWAHRLELPYVNGTSSYPPPDPTVGGGLMAASSSLYPRGPVNVSRWLQPFPEDGSIPPMPGWRWVHTPGHTPGHVSLWREADRTLIAGDAFITTKQESAYAVATQRPELHGPPMYYTQDWIAARASVELLARLEPELAITGHGRPMHGPTFRTALHQLASRFDEVAVPEQGRYVREPARADETGTTHVPPRHP